MKLEHTPGPWEVLTAIERFDIFGDGEGMVDLSVVSYGGPGDPWIIADIADCQPGGDGPDARLIAAAPSMIEYLIEDILRAENTWVEMWVENPDNDIEATDDEIRAACRSHEINAKQIAIIEAATGRTWEELNA